MTKTVTRCLVGLLSLLLATACDPRSAAWGTHIAAGKKAYEQGDYAEAEKQIKAAVKNAEGFEPEDPRVATTLDNLGELYRAQGQYAEAETFHKRALAIWEKALGPDHPDVATSLNNLAGVYYMQDRYDEVLPLLQRSHAILEKELGPEHPTVAASLENYARLLRVVGLTAEAEELEERVRAIRGEE